MNVNITAPVFDKALLDGQYVKKDFNVIVAELIAPEELVESDETLLNFIVQEFNDQKKVQVSVMDLFNTLQKNKENISNKLLLSKLTSNVNLKIQLDEYLSKKKKENRRWLLGFGGFFIAAILFCLNYMGFLNFPSLSTGGKVVVINIDKLATSATVAAMNGKFTPQQSQEFANKYRDNLRAEIQSYTKKGYVIIDRSSIYAVDDAKDITDDILKNIGLKPAAPNDFDINYSDEQKYDVLRNFSSSRVGTLEDNIRKEALFKANKEYDKKLEQEEIFKNSNGQSIDIE